MLKKGPHKNADHDDTILEFAAKYASISHKKVLLSSFALMAEKSLKIRSSTPNGREGSDFKYPINSRSSTRSNHYEMCWLIPFRIGLGSSGQELSD